MGYPLHSHSSSLLFSALADDEAETRGSAELPRLLSKKGWWTGSKTGSGARAPLSASLCRYLAHSEQRRQGVRWAMTGTHFPFLYSCFSSFFLPSISFTKPLLHYSEVRSRWVKGVCFLISVCVLNIQCGQNCLPGLWGCEEHQDELQLHAWQNSQQLKLTSGYRVSYQRGCFRELRDVDTREREPSVTKSKD